MLISSLLLAGLYFALDMSLLRTQAGRDATATDDVSRAVFNRLALDLANVLGPNTPNSGGYPETAASTSLGSTASGGSSSTGSGEAGDMPPAGEGVEGTGPTLPLQAGILGGPSQMSLFVSRVPAVLARRGALAGLSDLPDQQTSDLWRIDYWLGTNGGLCRKVRPWVTGEGTGTSPDVDRSTEPLDVILPDVSAVSFEYYDGGGSTFDSWEGGTGETPAPPAAVRVTLSIRTPNPRGGEPIERTISQVFVLRTAPGSYTPELIDPVVSTGTTTPDQESNTGTGRGSSSSSGGSGGSGGSGSGGTGGTGGGGGSGGKGGGPGGGGGTGGGTGGKGGGPGGGGGTGGGGGKGGGR